MIRARRGDKDLEGTRDGIARFIVTHSEMMVTQSEEGTRLLVWSELPGRPVEANSAASDP
jgi:hypothetical protein